MLGVEKGASSDEIKKAFRKLAHQHHPDKGGDEKKFKEISEAYQVLSDEKKRTAYDTYGDPAAAEGFGGQGFDPSGFGGFNTQGFNNVDLNDLFGDFFGGGRSSGGAQKKRGRDVSVDVQLSFSEAIFGVERKVTLTKASTCTVCSGSGGKPGASTKTCATCEGRGRIEETKRSFLGVFTQMSDCTVCGGTGKIPSEKCIECKGHGVTHRENTFTVTVPAGIEHGQTLRLTGAGEAVKNGTTGDLYIRVHVAAHKVFHREGQNLVMSLSVKMTDAILGAEYPIETLDGKITLTIPKGISSGETLRVRNKGVPTTSKHRGDLLVHVVIKTPEKLSKNALKLVEELKKEGV